MKEVYTSIDNLQTNCYYVRMFGDGGFQIVKILEVTNLNGYVRVRFVRWNTFDTNGSEREWIKHVNDNKLVPGKFICIDKEVARRLIESLKRTQTIRSILQS